METGYRDFIEKTEGYFLSDWTEISTGSFRSGNFEETEVSAECADHLLQQKGRGWWNRAFKKF